MFTKQEARSPSSLLVSLLAALTLAACSRADEPAAVPSYQEVPTWTVTPADSSHASPTATPRPTWTPKPPTSVLPTRTPRPTAAPSCALEDVPEPPFSNLDCETWETSYILWSLELGGPAPASQLPRIATEVYPALEASAQSCGVSTMQFGLYIHAAADQLKQEGKPSSSPNTPIAYLIGYFETLTITGVLKETVQRTGGCVEAFSLLTAMIE